MVHNIGLLSHNYIFEEVREDSVLEEVPSVAKDCYYSKNIKGKVLSAITICNNNVVSTFLIFLCCSILGYTYICTNSRTSNYHYNLT